MKQISFADQWSLGFACKYVVWTTMMETIALNLSTMNLHAFLFVCATHVFSIKLPSHF